MKKWNSRREFNAHRIGLQVKQLFPAISRMHEGFAVGILTMHRMRCNLEICDQSFE